MRLGKKNNIKEHYQNKDIWIIHGVHLFSYNFWSNLVLAPLKAHNNKSYYIFPFPPSIFTFVFKWTLLESFFAVTLVSGAHSLFPINKHTKNSMEILLYAKYCLTIIFRNFFLRFFSVFIPLIILFMTFYPSKRFHFVLVTFNSSTFLICSSNHWATLARHLFSNWISAFYNLRICNLPNNIVNFCATIFQHRSLTTKMNAHSLKV